MLVSVVSFDVRNFISIEFTVEGVFFEKHFERILSLLKDPGF